MFLLGWLGSCAPSWLPCELPVAAMCRHDGFGQPFLARADGVCTLEDTLASEWNGRAVSHHCEVCPCGASATWGEPPDCAVDEDACVPPLPMVDSLSARCVGDGIEGRPP